MLQRVLKIGTAGFIAGLWPMTLLWTGNPTVSLHEAALALPVAFGLIAAYLGERLHLRAITLLAAAILGGYLSLFSVPVQPTSNVLRPDTLYAFVGLLTVLGVCLCWIKQDWLLAIPALPQVAAILIVFAILPRLYPEQSWIVRAWTWRGSVPVVGWVNWGALMAVGALSYRWFLTERPSAAPVLTGLALSCFWIMEGALLQGADLHFAPELFGSVPFLCALSFVIYGELHLYWQRIYLDELTGVLNRRALNERLWSLRPHYSRSHYTVAMIDIDHFKRFNDTFGHEQGDTVLRFVANHFQNPQHGTCYRFGGEEFCIVFENISSPHAARILNKMREDLAAKTFHIRASKQARQLTSRKDRKPTPKSSKVGITVSIGIAEPQADAQTADDVLKAADAALYRAKHLGRNRVMESAPTQTNFVAQVYKP